MPSSQFAVVGLGNPGEKYQDTRHNVGFRVVEALADLLERGSAAGRASGPTAWKSKNGCLYKRVSVASAAGELPVYLILPQKFMNLSGEAAVPLLNFLKIPVEDLIVVHDELDLDPGTVVLKQGGGIAGNNGLENLVQHLNTQNFARIRVGIGHPRRAAKEGERVTEVSNWVLSKPRREELELLEEAALRAVDALKFIAEQGGLHEGFARAQQKFSRRVRSSEPSKDEA